jgi:hypothetical protein
LRVRAVIVALVLGSLALVSMGADSCSEGGGGSDDSERNTSQQSQSEKPAAEEPEMTSGQENALQVAQDYIDLSGFSKAGLIDQLSSPAGEGFSEADATFAANNVDADWNAEAVEAAEAYLDLGGMSKSALIDQLSSSAGDKFTPAQAEYAADKVY